jgi:S1-C subfamily serine protease
MIALSEILAIVTLIIQIQNGQPLGTATGFFYIKNDTVYLVTNRHVVMDEEKKIKPDTLRIKLHTDPKDLAKNTPVEIPLYSKGVPKWHVHPDYPTKKIDLTVIELDQNLLKPEYYFKGLTASSLLSNDYEIQPGEDVMAIGFPRGLSDTVHNLPLIRNATISSAYGVSFQGSPFFLIDANLHPGMSGSPVTTKPWTIRRNRKGELKSWTKEPAIYFLGVHSATLGITLQSGEEPLGLGTVWYGNLIEEIIDSFKKK